MITGATNTGHWFLGAAVGAFSSGLVCVIIPLVQHCSQSVKRVSRCSRCVLRMRPRRRWTCRSSWSCRDEWRNWSRTNSHSGCSWITEKKPKKKRQKYGLKLIVKSRNRQKSFISASYSYFLLNGLYLHLYLSKKEVEEQITVGRAELDLETLKVWLPQVHVWLWGQSKISFNESKRRCPQRVLILTYRKTATRTLREIETQIICICLTCWWFSKCL